MSAIDYSTRHVYTDIKEERERQDRQWGGPGHDDEHGFDIWQGFIGKHWAKFGKAMGAGFDSQWKDAIFVDPAVIAEIRHRAIVIAALMVALIESIDRRYPARPRNATGKPAFVQPQPQEEKR